MAFTSTFIIIKNILRELNKLLRPDREDDLEVTVGSKVLGGEELANKFNDYFTSLASSNHNTAAVELLGVLPNEHSAFFEPTSLAEVS